MSLEGVPSTTESTELDSFLTYLYGESEGFVYVPTREKDRGAWTQNFFRWPEQRLNIIHHIEINTTDREVYIGPALFSGESSEKSSFLLSNVAWAELDGRLPESLGNVPSPTLRIQSSNPGHEHWYWKLTEPITDIHQLEGINGSLTYGLGADVSGWDGNQVLRPPATINHKRDRPVAVLSYGDTRYSPTAFSHLEVGPIQSAEIDASTIPDVATVILKYAFNETAIRQFRSSPSEGERSTALMSLGYLCAEMGMSDVEIFSVIRNADDRWGKFRDRTDRVRRLSDLIARVRLKHPAIVSPEKLEKLPTYGFKSFMETDVHLEWLIDGILQASGCMVLAGPSGVGKTQWSLQWAIHLALGKDFLGFTITRPTKVVFFSLEMGHADLKYFFTHMANELSEQDFETLEFNLIIIPLGESVYMDTPKGMSLVESVIKEHEPDGVFIDSLGSSTTGDLNESTVKLIMDFSDRIRQRYSLFTWFIHHNRKAQSDNRKPNKLSDVYGGQYIVNRATSVFCLWPEKADIEVIELKVRLKPKSEPFRIQRTQNLNFIRLATTIFQHQSKTLTYKAPEEPQRIIVTEDVEITATVNGEGFVTETHKKPEPPSMGKLSGGM